MFNIGYDLYRWCRLRCFLCYHAFMKLIFALGNPEPEFTHTRHNVGKDILNQYTQAYFSDYSWEFKKKFKSELIFTSKPRASHNSFLKEIKELFFNQKESHDQYMGGINNMGEQQYSHTTKIKPVEAILAKPTSYMNEVGIPLQKIATFYKIQPEDILIIYDELDLLVGEYKLIQGRGSRIHNGVKSVNSSIKNANKIWHLKIGVRDENIGPSVQKSGRDPKKYVLAKLPMTDKKKISKLAEESIFNDLNQWLSKKD